MITRKHENNLMSQVIRFGSFIETAGQVTDDLSLDIQEQTKNILENIESLLNEVGANKNNLTRIQIWMSDISQFDAMNAVYEMWLENSSKPVRACVESKLVSTYLIEIQAFAYIE